LAFGSATNLPGVPNLPVDATKGQQGSGNGKNGLPRIDSVYANAGMAGMVKEKGPAVPPKEENKVVKKERSLEGMESELGDWLKLSGMLDRL